MANIHPDLAGDLFAMTTEWGLFHRLDIAMKHAMKDNAAVEEIFDISGLLGSLFGNGDGRVISSPSEISLRPG